MYQPLDCVHVSILRIKDCSPRIAERRLERPPSDGLAMTWKKDDASYVIARNPPLADDEAISSYSLV
jgi:hypothetical protein